MYFRQQKMEFDELTKSNAPDAYYQLSLLTSGVILELITLVGSCAFEYMTDEDSIFLRDCYETLAGLFHIKEE